MVLMSDWELISTRWDIQPGGLEGYLRRHYTLPRSLYPVIEQRRDLENGGLIFRFTGIHKPVKHIGTWDMKRKLRFYWLKLKRRVNGHHDHKSN